MADSSKKVCHRCGRQFARLEHLQRHERSHTKEKPFSCSICPKAFTRKDLLKRHNRIYHGQDSTANTGEGDNLEVLGGNIAQFLSQVPESSGPDILPHESSAQVNNSEGFVPIQGQHASFLDQPVPPVGFGSLYPRQETDETGNWIADYGPSDFPTSSYVGDDFSDFVDSIGFPSNPFDPSYQPVPDWLPITPSSMHAGVSEPLPADRGQATVDIGAEELDVESTSTPWASRLPSEQPQGQHKGLPPQFRRAARNDVAQVTQECREEMMEKLKTYSSILPADFALPSRHTLTCFVTGFVTIFNEHYPIIHSPTLKLETLSLELFLSIAAMGARYYWERKKGQELFDVARTITYERFHGRAALSKQPSVEYHEVLQIAQALLLLIAASTWDESGKSEAFSLRSLVEEVLRSDALDLHSPTQENSWLHWKYYEEVKRTKLVTYCFFNLQTITFDVAPMMLYRDFRTGLACSNQLWRAQTVERWHELKAAEEPEVSFSTAFQALFASPQEGTNRPGQPSPLSGHCLLQAIIQHIWLSQQAGNLPIRHTLASTEAANAVELALRRWRLRWETEYDTAGDASKSDGPIPFTSRALLRLAYIRLNIDSGSSRSIGTWNPEQIAKSLRRHAPVERNEQMTRAALHCAQALGIPIKLGLNFIAHIQVYYWSNQYALCSLECALLLTKWLEAVVIPNPVPPLSEREQKLLDFIVQLVNHTEYEAPRETLLQDNKNLKIIMLRLWAKLFKPDAVWQIVETIGKSLLAYADLLEQEQDTTDNF